MPPRLLRGQFHPGPLLASVVVVGGLMAVSLQRSQPKRPVFERPIDLCRSIALSPDERLLVIGGVEFSRRFHGPPTRGVVNLLWPSTSGGNAPEPSRRFADIIPSDTRSACRVG
jgi:hypothetical protein